MIPFSLVLIINNYTEDYVAPTSVCSRSVLANKCTIHIDPFVFSSLITYTFSRVLSSSLTLQHLTEKYDFNLIYVKLSNCSSGYHIREGYCKMHGPFPVDRSADGPAHWTRLDCIRYHRRRRFRFPVVSGKLVFHGPNGDAAAPNSHVLMQL